jgi:hypothetical protein
MQEHALDDRIGALAMLHDLFEIATQHIGQLFELGVRSRINGYSAQSILQLVDQLGRDARKIVDEIEWVFDLVRDASGELAK